MQECYNEVRSGNEIRSVVMQGARLNEINTGKIDGTFTWKVGQRLLVFTVAFIVVALLSLSLVLHFSRRLTRQISNFRSCFFALGAGHSTFSG